MHYLPIAPLIACEIHGYPTAVATIDEELRIGQQFIQRCQIAILFNDLLNARTIHTLSILSLQVCQLCLTQCVVNAQRRCLKNLQGRIDILITDDPL